jgi:hypothetical protein
MLRVAKRVDTGVLRVVKWAKTGMLWVVKRARPPKCYALMLYTEEKLTAQTPYQKRLIFQGL